MWGLVGVWAVCGAGIAWMLKLLRDDKLVEEEAKKSDEPNVRVATFYDAGGEPVTLSIQQSADNTDDEIVEVCVRALES